MTKCNKYKFQDRELLVYGEEISLPTQFELEEENVDPSKDENCNLPIINISHFNPFKRTRDSILELEGFSTYSDFEFAYFLLMNKKLSRSRKVREMVLEKYTELVELVKNDGSRENTGDDGNLCQSDNVD